MASKTDICNLALSHLGQGKEISDIDTEQSQEASACRRFINDALDATLIDHDWSFATRFETLGLITASPTSEWGYSYRYPSDCLKVRRILSGLRQDSESSKIPFKIIQDDAGKVIYTDQANAEVEKTVTISDPEYFTAQFSLALSFRLAAYISPRITGGDPFKMKSEMLAQYAIELQAAKTNDLNELRLDKKPKSEFETGRQ
jgi:hypothetical protein